MLILIPMNGKGKRFGDYPVPKPFLEVGGIPIIQKIVCGLALLGDIYILARKEYVNQLVSMKLRAQVAEMSKDTPGPLGTVLEYQDMFNTQKDCLIADCDSFFEEVAELKRAIKLFRKSGAYGGVTVRQSVNPAYSYARLDGDEVVETREKDAFSPYTTTGPYWFSAFNEFRNYALQAQESGVDSISPVYNWYVRDGKVVKAAHVETFVHVGTPEEYFEYTTRADHSGTDV